MPAEADRSADIVIIGAGIAGIATAYYLCAINSARSVLLVDSRPPMSFTSANSGDNYRNWWPHQTMTDFTNDSIDELDRLARDSDDFFQMTRGGYVLATRKSDVSDLVENIPGNIDVDVVTAHANICDRYPALHDAIRNVIHIRRAGDISGQQLGQYLLQQIRGKNFSRLTGEVVDISSEQTYRLTVSTGNHVEVIQAGVVVNAAGPFANRIANMLDLSLPVKNIYQQKIAFEDTFGTIPRDMPFSIDLDDKRLNWSDEERDQLAEDPELAWLTEPMPAGTHCRPDGGANGRWVKLGWAYNEKQSEPMQDMASEPAIDPQFPEIVIRGAAAFLPSLQAYVESPPARFSHYGGYYTMTEENWPLIGPLDNKGAFVVAALSGFGSMAAVAAGKLCAAHITGSTLPDYAADLSFERLGNKRLMAELNAASNKGLL